MRSTLELFTRVRQDMGQEIELLHDVHERLPLPDALAFAKEMEAFHLFYLEDALPPSQGGYFRVLRENTTTPLAMGELFVNNNEWLTLVQNRWIDYIRTHLSFIGGLTPARKMAAFAEMYGVRTAWHGPGDLTPVGMAAQIHLDTAIHNFGIQEFQGFNEAEKEVFQGVPELRDGYAYLNDRPGFGIEVDEAAAAKYPPVEMDFGWLYPRLQDGTAVRP